MGSQEINLNSRLITPNHKMKPSRKRSGPTASSNRPAKRVDATDSKAVNILQNTEVRKVRRRAQDEVLNNAPQIALQVYACGEGSGGELGLGPQNAKEVKTPRANPNLAGVVSVATGGMHAAALTADYQILTWGVNDLHTLGRDTTWDGGMQDIDEDSSEAEILNPLESTPTVLPSSSFPVGTKFTQVVAGDSTTFALTDRGLVYGWGTFRVSPLPALYKCPS